MWCHRIVRDNGAFLVGEVYFDDADNPFAYGKAEAVHQVGLDEGDPVSSVRGQLLDMLHATSKPVLNYPEDFIGKRP